MRVEVNQVAPDFSLPTADGASLQLQSLRGRKVILFFYPRDHSHRKFSNNRKLPFPILSDSDGAVCRRYGANSLLLLGNTGRVTYLIDEVGIVAAIFSSLFRPFEHVRRARDWVINSHKDVEENVSTGLKNCKAFNPGS